ncbi:chaperonin 10-like protein [Aspergillus granulosus]|uniref:Chaperonin 10-like protein n=1 Tax=Aspergillus granulosus TaxID=176169 RepID=A0ABR4H542_9EURO
MSTHLAAVSLAKGESFTIQPRLTPKPGPGELLIAVKSIALNPADTQMRNHGLFIPTYPTVIGFDIAGLVLEVGENVPVSRTDGLETPGLFFQAGITRVAAYCVTVWKSCDPNYGAFQEKCLVPWQHAVPLPDEGISWNEAATLPVAVQVPLSAWDALGIPRVGEAVDQVSADANDGSQQNVRKKKREALLIWGASSSVGTMGVQTARVQREDRGSSIGAVYATASAKNHGYVRSLGADRVFDYKDPQVVNAIVSAARTEGLVIRHCFLATGEISLCQAVLKAFLRDEQGEQKAEARIASAPVIPPDTKIVEGVETIFVTPSMENEERRLTQFRYWIGTWLRENLGNGNIRPSPEPRVVGKGVEAINVGLDELTKGVSCVKLVVEIAG